MWIDKVDDGFFYVIWKDFVMGEVCKELFEIVLFVIGKNFIKIDI